MTQERQKTPLRFAGLVRVSTERQKDKGESLKIQKRVIGNAVDALGGKVQWYGGNEHATPEQERRILDQLMEDALAGKFDAVIVSDPSRWSRDNRRSKDDLKTLLTNGIKFYVGTKELDLLDPQDWFSLGMQVEVAEFQAGYLIKRSMEGRIEKAKNGHPSSSGRLPFGRQFDKKSGTWSIDEKAQTRVKEMARMYIEEDVSFKKLGSLFGMDPSVVHKTLTKRCGDIWPQRFRNKRLGMDVTVPTPVPRLLPESTIERIKAKAEARTTYEHGSQKYNYLFSRIIFDADTGRSLTGFSSSKGYRYYRPFAGGPKYMLNADVIEKALLEELIYALSTNGTIRKAVFDGNSVDKVRDQWLKQKATYEGELKTVENKLSNLVEGLLHFKGNSIGRFCQKIEEKKEGLEKTYEEIQSKIQSIDDHLNWLPTNQEIEDERVRMRRSFLQRIKLSYFTSGHPFENLSFEEMKKLINSIFGGKDPDGKRYGIYIKHLGGPEKKFRFDAHGKLGTMIGSVSRGTTGKYSYYADAVLFTFEQEYTENERTVSEAIARLVVDANPNLVEDVPGVKERRRGECETCQECPWAKERCSGLSVALAASHLWAASRVVSA